MKTLREFKEAIRFIYVCSNHKLPLKNLLDFSSLSGHVSDPDPIIPVRIIPIDMTPHTLRSELVILCERFDLSSMTLRQRKTPEMNVGGRVELANTMKPFYQSSSVPTRSSSLSSTNPHNKFMSMSASVPHHSRPSSSYIPPSQPTYSNRFSSSSSFPPRVSLHDSNNAFGGTSGTSRTTALDDYYAEDRYSSFRRDFENAIDSSFDSAVNTNEFLPLEVVRKIEERAFREGLTRGIQQCAYQVGYRLGLRSSAEKLLNYDELIGIIGSGSGSGGNNGSSSDLPNCNSSIGSSTGGSGVNLNIWDNSKFGTSTMNDSTSSSASSSWNSIGSTSGNGASSNNLGINNCFQIWNRSASTSFGSGSNSSGALSQSALWK